MQEETEAYKVYLTVIEAIQGEGIPVQASRMFGMPAIKLNSKVIGGFYEDHLTVKLDGEALERGKELPGATLFDPMGGRPMKQWVQAPFSLQDRWQELVIEAVQSLG